MHNKKLKNIILTFFLTLLAGGFYSTNYAQLKDSTFHISAYLGVGYARFISDMDTDGFNKNGFSGTIRLMWEPDHLLSLGLESGYLQLYKLSNKQVSVLGNDFEVSTELTAIPIFAVFSMKIVENFKLSIGSGLLILGSSVDALGNSVSSSQTSTGAFGAASYLYPLSKMFFLGGELKYFYINKIENGDLSLQLMLWVNLLSY